MTGPEAAEVEIGAASPPRGEAPARRHEINGRVYRIQGDDTMKKSRTILRAVAAGAALAFSALAAPQAQAQTNPDKWQFQGAVYGWFPALAGTTKFPSGNGGPSIDVDADTVISHLKMTFMGNIAASKGQWGVFADWMYSDLGGSKDGTRDLAIGGRPIPATATSNLSLDIKTNVLTLAGTYAAIQRPEHDLKLLFGARMLDMKQKLDWQVSGDLGPIQLPGRSGRVEVSATNWDAVAGLGGRLRFGEGLRWSVPYYVDVGAGESQFTWQVQGGIAYSFGWGDLAATWRYLDYRFKSDSALQTFSFNGPAIGAIFRW